jgi:hypothetical protein
VADREAADRAIAGLLFAGAAPDALTALARAAGADLAMVRRVGDAIVLARMVTSSEPGHRAEVVRLARAAADVGDPRARTRRLLALARVHETRAAVHLQILAFVGPLITQLRALAATLEGLPAVVRRDVSLEAEVALRGLPDLFDYELLAARSIYATCYDRPLGETLHPRIRTRAFMKVLEHTKLRVLTAAPAELPLLRRMLEDFGAYQDGRNGSFASFAGHELGACADLESLRRSAGSWRGATYQGARRALRDATGR